MRPPRAFGLAALLAALAGCGSSATDTRSVVQKQREADAAQFKMEKGDRTKPGVVPNPLTDVDGRPVDLAGYRGHKSVVLVVVKGLPKENNPARQFCPGCLAQLHSLVANYEEFKRRDAEVVLVFPGPPDALPKFLADGLAADGTRPPFPVVSDSELKAVKALGIAGDWAKPSTYILDKAGSVVFAYSAPKESTYDRPSVGALLEQLDRINGTK